MFLQHKKVAIVGGGPGGLTLARLLQLKGAEVQVFERDSDSAARQQGATLDLHEGSGLEAIKRAGLEKSFYANYRPGAGKMRVLDQHAVIHLDDHEQSNESGESRPEIDRAPLRNLLIDALLPGSISWDSQFVSMEKEHDGYVLHFKNGQNTYADMVIAADGANSKIRPYITSVQALYSGITIVEGNVNQAAQNAPKLWEMVKGGKVFAFGHAASLILSAKGDGSLSFYTGNKVPEHWVQQSGIDFQDKKQVFDWFKMAYASWDGVFQELFASNELWFVPRPQYHFPLNQRWESLPNITMIGDAVHRMPPYAGEGANMAMQDALELADCLTSDQFPTMHSAISSYEEQMLKRAAEVTQQTLTSTEHLHAPDAIERLLLMFKEVRG